jgi:hypothetical protein
MTNIEIGNATKALNKIIKKSRVHFYKPIQIAEILYRNRVMKDIDLSKLETYRTISKKWRDIVSLKFVGRICTSSAKFQDNIFEQNALTPKDISILGDVNNQNDGKIEAYIYKKFQQKHYQMVAGLDYCTKNSVDSFEITKFINHFRDDPGLKRSVDKIFEIIVYALFSALVIELGVTIRVSADKNKLYLLNEFSDFCKEVIGITSEKLYSECPANVYRVGVTNAADRGLDMWANFGLAIQIKHLALTEELTEDIVSSISCDRIVIVCKDAEKKLILSLLNQLGWKSRIQSIITENDLIKWYHKAFKGNYSKSLGNKILSILKNEIKAEFPTSDETDFKRFCKARGYEIY